MRDATCLFPNKFVDLQFQEIKGVQGKQIIVQVYGNKIIFAWL